MLAAAKFNPTIEIPHWVVDMIMIEQQICQFVHDIGSGTTTSLLPMEKQSREQIYELSHAFNLKSQSKGKGEARYSGGQNRSNVLYFWKESPISLEIKY